MGNLQGSEGKQSKTGKSPGKGKNLIKSLSNKKANKDAQKAAILRKKSESQCSKSLQESTDNIAEDTTDSTQPNKRNALTASDAEPEEGVSNHGARSTNLDHSFRQQNKARDASTKQPAKPNQLTTENGLLSVAKKKEISPPSKESSSESVFTDPLTPGGFAAELNAAYYSEESVTATPDEARSSDVVLHIDPTIKRNGSRLDKLSVSKISRVSLDDENSNDNSNVFLVAERMPDACANNAHSMDSGLGSRLPTQIFNGEDSNVKQDIVNDSGIMDDNEASFSKEDAAAVEGNENDFKLKGSTPVASFTLSRHRKVEIPPSKPPDSAGNDARDHRRHSSMSDSPVLGDSNVLRKVASLTLDRATLESKVSKPKFVPEKLDFQIYEKFEGQMLVNWFVSAFADNHYLRMVLTGQDLRVIGTQYCTHLLAAGVLRQITDKDAPNESIFRPDLMYYWAHTETPNVPPATPGRIQTVSWPPTQDSISNQKSPEQLTPGSRKKKINLPIFDNKLDMSVQSESPKIDNELFNLRLQSNEQDISMNNKNVTDNSATTQKMKELENIVNNLSRELERYKTLVDIQSLTQNAIRDFGSPTIEAKNSCYKDFDVHKSAENDDKFGRIERAEPFFNNDMSSMLDECNIESILDQSLSKSYDDSCFSNNEKQKTNKISPTTYQSNEKFNSLKSSPISQSDKDFNEPTTSLNNASPPLPELDMNGGNFRSLSPISDADFPPPPPSIDIDSSIKNGYSFSPSKSSLDKVAILSNAEAGLTSLTPPPPSPVLDKAQLLVDESLPPPPLITSIVSMPPPTSGGGACLPALIECEPSSPVSAAEPSIESKLLSIDGIKNNENVITSINSEVPLSSLSTNLESLPKTTTEVVASSSSLSEVEPPPPPPMSGIGPSSPPLSGAGPPPPPMSEMGPPPPPMPDMGPPPPPMAGMGPPPPPMPGMGPPPPPMPGMGPPPPPMPGSGPPPPPMPGMGPPPPPCPGSFSGSGPPPPPPAPGMPPPPPSGIPPPPMPGMAPVPFPAPPAGGWQPYKETMRKKPVNPTVPMKPLYWTRIIAPPEPQTVTDEESISSSKPLWMEIEEAKLENISEFADLFSRQVITRKPTKKKVDEKPSKIQAAKILDGKRFQNVGILAQSLHVEFADIENAIYCFDTTVVNLEALHQIYEARATEEELQKIKDHLKNYPDIPLDKPETFLLELSDIQCYAERISCFTFQAEFDDSIMAISSKLDNIKRTCEFLTTNEGLRRLFAIILTLGNYMNGGNRQRGQADGFGLEILSKLRDVKSKDSSVTLLHFIVRTYIAESKEGIDTPLPIPEPGDIGRASFILFEEVTSELTTLQKQWKSCELKTNKVIAKSTEENLHPFKEKMTTFLERAEKQLLTENENLTECQTKFIYTMKFYQFSPKSGTLEDCSPKEFFDLWSQFCRDFKDIWKKEENKMIKEKLKEKKRQQDERLSKIQNEPKRKEGLKAKMQRLSSRLS